MIDQRPRNSALGLPGSLVLKPPIELVRMDLTGLPVAASR